MPAATSLVVPGLDLSEMTVMEHRGTKWGMHMAVASPTTPAPTTAIRVVSMGLAGGREGLQALL